MGVKRAVELVLKTAGENPGPIYTWGPLIHNPQTVDFLREQGVEILEDISNIPSKSTVIIRSHGIPPEERDTIASSDVTLCDATCPKVARVQALIKKAAKEGDLVVIVGNEDHAEVRGLVGFAGEHAVVVADEEEARQIEFEGGVSVFGQTTINREKYERIARVIKSNNASAKIFDTLCDSTSGRQAEISELSLDADAIVVVGGKNSGNTRRLYEVAVDTGKPTFWIETADELSKENFLGMTTVAVTAGASTPHWIVSRVVEKLEAMNELRLPPWEWPRLKAIGFVIIQSNILTGLSAAMLGFSAVFLAGGGFNLPLFIATGLFMMSVHTLYNLVDWQGLALVDPSKIRFFWGNRKFLGIVSALGFMIAIPLSILSGTTSFILMCIGSVFALAFVSMKGMPRFLKARGFGTWRSIPGAKDILHAIAWIFVAGLVPVLSVAPPIWLGALAVLWVAVFAVLRAMLFSITDMETDRVLGRESIASIVGEKRAWYSTYVLMALACAIMIAGISLRVFAFQTAVEFGFLLYMTLLIAYFRRKGISRGTWAELAVDFGLLLSGAFPLLILLLK